MANNFEAAAFALQCAFPKNKILMDDKGMPSVFVWIPAFRLCDVLSTTSTDIHPAFRVNGKEIAGFYFGKYQTKVYNERAYSLPAEDPTVSQNFDWFASKTKANGTGWHEATVAEWAAVALWCHKRGCEPRGNNNYGKDANESTYDAIPAPGVQDSGKTARVLTGTGPLPWSHNGQMDGIWDMNGNVWEWLLGLRLYKGELQIIADNNAADNSVSTAASSAAWKAIRASDGALITPDGNGTTSGSIKLNVVSSTVKDKRVVLVDDSIVRGTTSEQIIEMAREAGAKKVYLASAAPEIRFPNVYGIDMPSATELIAHGREVDEIRQIIGADGLIFQDLNDLIEAVRAENPDIQQFECSVFNGVYVTKDVDQGYLDFLDTLRNDDAKAVQRQNEVENLEMHNEG